GCASFGGDRPVPHADDRRWIRGRQRRRRAAPRPDVQTGAGSLAGGRGAVLAIDDLAAGKPPRPAGIAAPWAGARRAVLWLVPSGAEAHHSRYRRHPRFREGRLFDAFMAASNCACSTPITTITAFSRSPGQARGLCA